VGPVRTQFGLHIIKVSGRDSRELKISDIRIAVTPSSQTKSALSERAQDFAYNAKHSELVTEAHSLGMEVKETQVLEKGGVVPGIGVNESVTRWAFQNKVGSVSDPLVIPNGSAVFLITEAKDAGVKTFEETKESVRPLALRKKKLEKAKELAAAIRASLGPTDSLTKVSERNAVVKVQRTGPFTLGGSVPGIGREMSFLGAVAGLSPGEISPPVQGFRGAYLIQLVARTPFDSSAYAQQKDGLRTQLLQEKRNRYLSDWLAKLKADATIEDHRDMFYR
jgi:peptidylprolyl isomerase/peptidyl-prolyl cis-trans isomerase D